MHWPLLQTWWKRLMGKSVTQPILVFKGLLVLQCTKPSTMYLLTSSGRRRLERQCTNMNTNSSKLAKPLRHMPRGSSAKRVPFPKAALVQTRTMDAIADNRTTFSLYGSMYIAPVSKRTQLGQQRQTLWKKQRFVRFPQDLLRRCTKDISHHQARNCTPGRPSSTCKNKSN